ncbi:MAG: FKBP-type peptidyl-prolyl cis-trans isomerase [Bacteroidota bacterium]|nr:FKBP-type peptidyl-prolyl cis-trans isomerase [Bacteroidota bacterium]
MKRTSIVFFITFLFLIIMSACKQNEYMDWKLMNDKWYSIHKSDPGFITTPSGLCYKVIHQGYQRNPNINSWVEVNYKGTLIDGSVFDSVATGTSVGIWLSSSIKGWQEGLPKMNNGGHYIFYIPYKLGYDSATDNASIPAYSVLKFDVHLIDSQN